MPDLAELTLAIKSSQVKEATTHLNQMTMAGDRAEAMNKKLGVATDKTGVAAHSAAGGFKDMIVMMAALAAAAGIANLVKDTIRAAAAAEQTRIAYETLLGSAEKALEVIHELHIFAAETPFEFVGLSEAYKSLLAFGFKVEEVTPMLRILGDVASGLGMGQEGLSQLASALGRINAAGVLRSHEMLSMTAMGIPAWKMLAEAIGVDTLEAMKRVEARGISSAGAINVFLNALSIRFKDGMVKQSQTLLGLWSTFKDETHMLMQEFGEELVTALDLKNKLKGAIDGVKYLKDLLLETTQVMSGVTTVAGPLNEQAKYLASVITVVVNTLKVLIALKVALYIYDLAKQVLNLAYAFIHLHKAMIPVLMAFAVLVTITEAGTALYKNFESVQTWAENLIYTMKRLAVELETPARVVRELLLGTIPDFAESDATHNKLADIETAHQMMLSDIKKGLNEQADPNRKNWLEESLSAAVETLKKYGNVWGKIMSGFTLPESMGAPPGEHGPGLEKMTKEQIQSFEKYKEMMEKLQQTRRELRMDPLEAERDRAYWEMEQMGIERTTDKAKDYVAVLEKLQKEQRLVKLADDIGNAFGDAFTDAITGAKSFKAAIEDLTKSIMRMVVQMTVSEPIARAISGGLKGMFMPAMGGSGAGGLPAPSAPMPGSAGMSDLPVFAANGMVLWNGQVVAFDRGGVVNRPTLFPMAGGKSGMMGEDGEEGIFPLARDSRGRLGVRSASGGSKVTNVTMNVYTQNASSFRQSEHQVLGGLRRAIQG